MSNYQDAVAALREDVEKHDRDDEHSAGSYMTNLLMTTESHAGDPEDPEPSLIHGVARETLARTFITASGLLVELYSLAEEAFQDALDDLAEEGQEMDELTNQHWDSYLDGIQTAASGMMRVALAMADSAAADDLDPSQFLEGENT